MGQSGDNKYVSLAIKDIAMEDRPREKAMQQGMQGLTNAELLAIIIGSGSVGESVVDLSQRILNYYDNSLQKLSRASISELTRQFNGIGPAKAISILSALSIARNYVEEVNRGEVSEPINSPERAYHLMQYSIGMLDHEEFHIIALNNANREIRRFRIGQGGTNATIADVKIAMKECINCLAQSIIIYHNHPSGNPAPSKQDDILTKHFVDAAKFLDMRVHDHIIVCANKYFSYAEEGRL